MNAALMWLLLALGAVLYYATSCLFWPYAKCWRCQGNAQRRAWWGGGFGLCGTCDGTGRRLKFGRWIFNYINRKRKDAS